MNGPTASTVSVDVTFYDSFVPAIGNGEYTLTVAQTLTSDYPKVPSQPQQAVSQKFIVRGPSFGLDPADVHQVFPPSTSTGVWVDFLPMIVFNKRALPWERRMRFAVPNSEQYPWLALLVFSQDELPDSLEANSQANPTRVTSRSLNDVVHAVWNGNSTQGPPAGTIGPSITLADDENPNEIRVNVIDVSAVTFANLVPTANDLKYLAHVREVATDDKEPQNAVHDGWYSVIISNRFAAPPPQGADKVTNIAHLVSLEGLEQYIGINTPLTPSGPVRLISLFSWVFTSLPAPQENFRELMLNLISKSSEQGTDLLMRLPVENASAAQSEVQKAALQRLNHGYLPMSYATLTGENTFAWYRGPLAPAVTKQFLEALDTGSAATAEVPHNTSEAMIYDPDTGLFDQSYAVAFQTGRSLALADLPFAMNMLQWRREAHAAVDVLVEHTRSPHRQGILQSLEMQDGAEDWSRLLDRRLVKKAFLSYLATEFGKRVVSRVGKTSGVTPVNAEADRPVPLAPADLAEFTQRPQIVALLRQISGLESNGETTGPAVHSILPEQAVEWLAQTALLYGVPFSNLAPAARMLPGESIRFFYVDPNWINALLDGALSIGIQSSRDALLHRLMRDSINRKVFSVMHNVRERRRGVKLTKAGSAANSLAGFVMRSAAVSGWPGLEVRAFSDAARTKPITPLRLDRVSPSVLIGIFPEVPMALELNEPSEGLALGREEDGVLLRYLPGVRGATPTNIGTPLQPPTRLTSSEIDALRRPAPNGTGALKIAGASGLVQALQNKFPGAAPALSAASLAVEMAKVPEQMLFLPSIQGVR
jgi:hypothetical protein